MHVISLAQYAIAATRGWAADALNPRARQAAQNDQLQQEIQLLCEELRIKTARIAKLDPRRRPHYPATERMAILELKVARGWSLAQAARVFLVEPETVAAWLKRVDEQGGWALVQLRQPINRFPDFVDYSVVDRALFRPQRPTQLPNSLRTKVGGSLHRDDGGFGAGL